MIRAHEFVDIPPNAPTSEMAAPDQVSVIDVPFDGIAGMGIRVQPWYAANGQRFVGLTFTSDLTEQSHDLTPDQALALRDALTKLAGPTT